MLCWGIRGTRGGKSRRIESKGRCSYLCTRMLLASTCNFLLPFSRTVPFSFGLNAFDTEVRLETTEGALEVFVKCCSKITSMYLEIVVVHSPSMHRDRERICTTTQIEPRCGVGSRKGSRAAKGGESRLSYPCLRHFCESLQAIRRSQPELRKTAFQEIHSQCTSCGDLYTVAKDWTRHLDGPWR